MNEKAIKLVRKYVRLFPLTMRDAVEKAIKRRWKGSPDKVRREMRSDMERALANPETSQQNILNMLARYAR